ncbi:MAG: hypothetical protein J7L15_05330 [Clostridiales bacterium]|nr:hypothetical protein [Clostridiales bacterium]
MKYKNKYDFAEKVINSLPWVKNVNIKVKLHEHSKSFKPRDGKGFTFGSEGMNATFLEYMVGVIDGLLYAYERLVKK